MATATTTDAYLQQIHTARTQLHACFKRAHELLTGREAQLVRELETIQNNYEAETTSQEEELQGLEASKLALQNNLRDNDTLNTALAAINKQIEQILTLSSDQARTIRFEWNTGLDRDLEQAGEIINTALPQSANLSPVTPQSTNLSPITPQPADLSSIAPQSTNLSSVAPQPADLSSITQSTNLSSITPQPATLKRIRPQSANISPIRPQYANLSPITPQPFPVYKNKSMPIITCCKHMEDKSTVPGELYYPNGLAIEPQTGRIYIADTNNHRVQVFTPNGEYSFLFSGNMNGPHGICINNTVYVSQWGGNYVTSYQLDGTYVNKVGSYGRMDGQFDSTRGLAVSPATGLLYVCDSNNHRVQVFSEELKFHSVFANNIVKYPNDVKLTPHLIFVLDRRDPCIHLFNIDNQTLLRSIVVNKQASTSFFTVDREMNILLTDYIKHCVCVFSQSGELITQFGKKGHTEGKFIGPTGIAIDTQNRIVVVSKNKNNALQLF